MAHLGDRRLLHPPAPGPLHQCVHLGTVEVERGAQVARKDARGRTAADVALGDAASASGRAGAEPQPKTAALLRDLMASTKTP